MIKAKFVKISYHAQARVIERFRIFMSEYDRRDPETFLRREFKYAYRDLAIEMVPFYKNYTTLTYGVGSFYAHSTNLTFMCKEIGEGVIITTVIKRRKNWTPIPKY